MRLLRWCCLPLLITWMGVALAQGEATRLAPWTLLDQFDRPYTLEPDLRVLLVARGMDASGLLDEALAEGIDLRIVVEAAHRTSILPLVMADVGHAILPSSWTPTARAMGLTALPLDPRPPLHISLISRTADLTPLAVAFLGHAREHAREEGPDGDELPTPQLG